MFYILTCHKTFGDYNKFETPMNLIYLRDLIFLVLGHINLLLLPYIIKANKLFSIG